MRHLFTGLCLIGLLGLGSCKLLEEVASSGGQGESRSVASFEALQLPITLPEGMADPLAAQPVGWIAVADARYDPTFERAAMLLGTVRSADAFRQHMEGRETLPEYVATARQFAEALNAAEEEAKGLGDKLDELKDQTGSEDVLLGKAILNGTNRARKNLQKVLAEAPSLALALLSLADQV